MSIHIREADVPKGGTTVIVKNVTREDGTQGMEVAKVPLLAALAVNIGRKGPYALGVTLDPVHVDRLTLTDLRSGRKMTTINATMHGFQKSATTQAGIRAQAIAALEFLLMTHTEANIARALDLSATWQEIEEEGKASSSRATKSMEAKP